MPREINPSRSSWERNFISKHYSRNVETLSSLLCQNRFLLCSGLFAVATTSTQGGGSLFQNIWVVFPTTIFPIPCAPIGLLLLHALRQQTNSSTPNNVAEALQSIYMHWRFLIKDTSDMTEDKYLSIAQVKNFISINYTENVEISNDLNRFSFLFTSLLFET